MGQLVILSGVPPEWLTQPLSNASMSTTATIQFQDMPTHWGNATLSWTPHNSETGEFVASLLVSGVNPPNGVRFHLPDGVGEGVVVRPCASNEGGNELREEEGVVTIPANGNACWCFSKGAECPVQS